MLRIVNSILLSFLFILPISYAQMSDNAIALGIDTTFGAGEFGGGISFVDFNEDGWDDLTFATEIGDSILFYINDQGTGFTRIPSLVDHVGFSKQVLWVDTDNDGDLDFFVCTEGGQNRLYRNDGSLTFSDITSTCGLLIQNDQSFGANFGDFDQDGDLDLFVSNRQLTSYGNTFYRNDGNHTFVNITSSVGINTNMELDFCSAFFDYDNDMDLDLYLIVDKADNNLLFQNNGSGSYTDVSAASGSEPRTDLCKAEICS